MGKEKETNKYEVAIRQATGDWVHDINDILDDLEAGKYGPRGGSKVERKKRRMQGAK